MLLTVIAALVSFRCSAPDAPDTDGGNGSGGNGFHFDAGAVIEACVPVDATADAAPAGDADATVPSCTPSRTDVHFGRDVRPILTACSGEICHVAQWAGPDPWPTMVGKPARECCDGRKIVDPGNPDGSYLLQKLEDHDLCAGRQMPYDQTPLATDKLQTLYDWICLGALND